ALVDLQKRLKGNTNVFEGKADLVTAVDDAITQTAISHPSAETLHLTVGGLNSNNPVLRYNALVALRKAPALKPKIEDPLPYRTVLEAAPKFKKSEESWEAILLLRQWTGRSFGAAGAKQWQKEHEQWSLWFNQTFPKETPLKPAIAVTPAESKYKFEELGKHLDKERGDAVRGKAVFEKANCFKCH